MNRDELVGAIELRLQNDALAHYGVKGSKWGYNKGRRNGKRTANDVLEVLSGVVGQAAANAKARDRAIKSESARIKADAASIDKSLSTKRAPTLNGATARNAKAAYEGRQKKVQTQLKKYIRQRNADAQTAGRAKRERARANSAVRKSQAGKGRSNRRG